jgi:hypothetical protein
MPAAPKITGIKNLVGFFVIAYLRGVKETLQERQV